MKRQKRMMMTTACHSEVGRIETLLLKRPEAAWCNQDNIDRQWQELNYTGRPDYNAACREYEAFLGLISDIVPDIHFLPDASGTGLDSVYVRDASVVTDKGVILCNMGKQQRRGEPAVIGEFYASLGVPILGQITGEGRLEGGDVIWLDDKTPAVGEGYRTNAEGIRQLQRLTRGIVDECVVVPLPHWDGPNDVLHLMSMISPIDRDLAVVYSRMMPVPFRNLLLARGITLIEVPDSEYGSMACNILAVAPRQCIMLAGNPVTRQQLVDEGVRVWEFSGEEISKKGAGGPTCLTRPLRRDA